MKMQKVLHFKHELVKKKPKMNGEYLITEKLDGWYGYMDYYPQIGWTPIKSSRGRVIEAFSWFSEIAKTGWQPTFPCRLIFELIIPDTPFHIINGIFNRKSEQATQAILVFHDLISMDITVTAYNRYQILREHFNNLWPSTRITPILTISSKVRDWEDTFVEIVKAGGEGIVIKQLEGIYHPGKRNYTLLKMKQEVTLDLRIVEMFWSTGKKGEEALNMTVVRKSGTQLTVVVPKDTDKAKYLAEPFSFLGKIAEITAMKELKNGMLREPRFKCLREDKILTDLID